MKKTVNVVLMVTVIAFLLLCSSCKLKENQSNVTNPFADIEINNQNDRVESEDLASKFLIFTDVSQSKFGQRMANALIVGFNKVYPNLVETWCHGLYKDVVYLPNLETDVAYATSGSHSMEREIDINYQYLTSINEVDAITHELTHVCQEYVDGKYSDTASAEGGNWIIEGMTDYSRYMFGIYPESFALPAYSSSSIYTDSYRVTARFFLWINSNILSTFTEEFNEYLRSTPYRSSMFFDLTGYTLDELWQMYQDDNGRVENASGNLTSGSVTRK